MSIRIADSNNKCNVILEKHLIGCGKPNVFRGRRLVNILGIDFRISKIVSPLEPASVTRSSILLKMNGTFHQNLQINRPYGKGKVYRGGKVTGETLLIKVTIGFQAGGQAFSEMNFFQDKRSYDKFTSCKFAYDAAASAVAVTVGVQAKPVTEGAEASTRTGPSTGKQAKASCHKGMAVFVHTKSGLMHEASIGGQKVSFKPKEVKK